MKTVNILGTEYTIKNVNFCICLDFSVENCIYFDFFV